MNADEKYVKTFLQLFVRGLAQCLEVTIVT